jgi:signal peptidase
MPTKASDVRRGDIITFRNPRNINQTITHRVVATPSRTTDTFQTKGDANQAADKPIGASAIIGSVEYPIPKLGYVTDFIRRPLGLALLIYVPALLIIAAEMRRLTQYYRKQQPYIAAGYRRSR